MHRSVITQHLLDRVGYERRVADEPPLLVGVSEQGPHAVADEVHRRLVTGNEQKEDDAAQLGLAQTITLVFGGEQRAQQVVARSLAPVLEQIVEVADEAHGGDDSPLEHIPFDLAVEQSRCIARPPREEVAVVEGYSHELADDRDGQRVDDGRHEVDLAGVAELVEHAVNELLNMGTEPFDAPGSERLAHEPAEASVVGRVEEKEDARLEITQREPHVVAVATTRVEVLGVGAPAWVPQHRLAVGVAGEDELVEARVVPDRRPRPEALVQRVRIRAVLGRERVDVGQLEDLRLGQHGEIFPAASQHTIGRVTM